MFLFAVLLVCAGGRLLQAWMIVRPRPPTLTLSPDRPVRAGEEVTLTCSIISGDTPRRFTIFKDGKEIHSLIISFHTSYSYPFHSISQQDSGNYTCAFWISFKQYEFDSEVSPPVSVSVTDVLSAPSISPDLRNPVHARAAPPAPSISLSPDHPVFVEEVVTIECSVTSTDKASGFRFLKDGKEIFSVTVLSESSYCYRFHSRNHEDSGDYSCAYWISDLEDRVYSTESPTRSLSANDGLQPPSILLTPQYDIFAVGETIGVTCLLPSGFKYSSITYFKGEKEMFYVSAKTIKKDVVFSTDDMNVTESFSCAYRQWSGRIKAWNHSPQVSVNITDLLLTPVLSLDSWSGGDTDVANVTLICSAPTRYSNLTFHFLSKEEVIGSTSPALTERSAALSFTVTPETYSQKRTYSCYYDAVMRGQTLKSNASDPAQLTVSWPTSVTSE